MGEVKPEPALPRHSGSASAFTLRMRLVFLHLEVLRDQFPQPSRLLGLQEGKIGQLSGISLVIVELRVMWI